MALIAKPQAEHSVMKQRLGSYLLELQAEPSRFRKGIRYHWMITLTRKPDELVSWGYAITAELAEVEARNEVKDLDSGLSQGGQISKTHKAAFHRR
jgi:hypothetical protein